MKKSASFATSTIVLTALVGCTSLLGDFDVSKSSQDAGPVSTNEGGPACDKTLCGSDCVDTATSPAHCGNCETACSTEKTCQASQCACPIGKSFCNGSCTTADRAHCGETCIACQNDELCVGGAMGCKPAPAVEFEHVPRDPTGWLDETGTPIFVSLKSTNVPGTIYECRTGPVDTFTPTTPEWKTCDGSPEGAGLKSVITADSSVPEGTYRTEARYRSDTYRSPTISVVYYVLHKLDKVATCPRAGKPEDPTFTSQQMFDAARTFAQTHLAGFPLTTMFPAPNVDNPHKGDDIYLHAPFIKIPFKGITLTKNQLHGQLPSPTWPAVGGDYTLHELNLRHQYVLDSTREMLLVRRQYVRPEQKDCVMTFREGGRLSQTNWGPTGRGRRKLVCEGMVFNAHGTGLCIGRDPMNATKPVVLPFDEEPQTSQGIISLGANGVSVTAGSKSISATFAGSAFTTMVNTYYIQCPATTGYWYRFTAAADATHATLDVGYQGVTSSNVSCVRAPIDQSGAFIMEGAFAKLHEERHSPSVAGFPSKRTKCTVAGCDTAKPWLTYLPP